MIFPRVISDHLPRLCYSHASISNSTYRGIVCSPASSGRHSTKQLVPPFWKRPSGAPSASQGWSFGLWQALRTISKVRLHSLASKTTLSLHWRPNYAMMDSRCVTFGRFWDRREARNPASSYLLPRIGWFTNSGLAKNVSISGRQVCDQYRCPPRSLLSNSPQWNSLSGLVKTMHDLLRTKRAQVFRSITALDTSTPAGNCVNNSLLCTGEVAGRELNRGHNPNMLTALVIVESGSRKG